uniref:Protein hook n=1 Tax=Hirondellea gigas TaxID=1518452 RepID=A0A2P2I6G4_9CRUS
MDASSVCSGLIRWLETFPGLFAITVDSLADGVVMGTVLNIIDPSHFTEAWASRLKQDCGDNWRLKVSNLRKIQQSVVEYLQLVNVQYADHTLPDLNKIGETACPEEVGRMLQLILGCAMNCQYKERYIESIMVMPAEVQAVVMNTLQTVFMRDSSPGAEVAGPASFHPNHRTIAEQLETTTRARDEAVARVHELEMQLSEDSEERKELSEENAKLMERLIGLEDASELGGTGTASRYKDLKKKIDSLQDDLFKVETSRDEYRSRVEVLEREHAEMLQRSEELQRLADQAHRLQDEVDVLRDMGQRATVAETTIESYKKKLDELSDLRRQNKILEQKNADYLTHILELEEDVKKNDSWRPQLELFKKQVAELRQQLAEVTKKSDRLNFDNKKLTEKVEAITVEKDRVAFERDGLKENVEELRCQRSADPRGDLPRADLLSTDPQDVWEKLMRLQHENQQLKKQQQEGGQSEPVLQAMLSELQERHNCTSVENRQLNQRIMELESEVEESRSAGGLSTPTPSAASTLTVGNTSTNPAWSDAFKREYEKKLTLKNEEIATLRETLVKKDGEMAAMEERYKKYLNKAKSVIKTLDPKYNPSLVPDVATLRQQIYDKDRHIDNLERESEKAKAMRDIEEKRITTAFYNFGMNMHRQMVNHRLAAVEPGQHSFLPKPRSAGSQRRSNIGNRGSSSGSQMDEMRFS